MEELIRIGMAEIAVAKAPIKITTLGLGSCVGVCIFDPMLKVGGMAHIMLPLSTMSRGSINLAKFADTAVPLLVNEILKLGADLSRFKAKLAGGAQMFAVPGDSSNFFAIGSKNVLAVEDACQAMGIPILSRCVGGNSGKSITFDLVTGDLEVRTLNQGTIVI